MSYGNWGYGTGLNLNDSVTLYFYTVYVSSNVGETFDNICRVTQIQVYNNTTGGRLRLWKGTFTGDTPPNFVLDSSTPVVDIDMTGDGTGWLTYTAPTDFVAFDVTASTTLGFYSSSTAADGFICGGGTGVGNMFYGYSNTAPPYSGTITLTQGTSRRLEIKVEGDAIVYYELTGVTKDNDGVALGSCNCFLFKDNLDDTLTFIDHVVSNVSTGVYLFSGIIDNDANYLVFMIKDGSPNVFDVTDHVLQPTAE